MATATSPAALSSADNYQRVVQCMRLTPAFQIECFRNWNLRPLCHNQATLLLRQGSTSIGSLQCNKLKTFRNNQTSLAVPHNIKLLNRRQNLAVRAEYGDASRGGGGDFLAGFILGGAVFGTLAYVFAPQIRRSLLNEDEYGFRRAKRPIYYDGGLEKTRQTLNAKISQLNSAIDNVSSRLRRGKNMSVPEPDEVDSEIEATM